LTIIDDGNAASARLAALLPTADQQDKSIGQLALDALTKALSAYQALRPPVVDSHLPAVFAACNTAVRRAELVLAGRAGFDGKITLNPHVDTPFVDGAVPVLLARIQALMAYRELLGPDVLQALAGHEGALSTANAAANPPARVPPEIASAASALQAATTAANRFSDYLAAVP